MKLEDINSEELLIKEAIIQWSNEKADKADKYLERNRLSMDGKMYFALGQLYIKMYRKNHPN
jgi:hypothetical protein